MSPKHLRGLYLHQTDKHFREVNTMAASIFVEVESGTYSGRVHPHNGYYAGDFSTPRQESQEQSSPVTVSF